MLGGGVSRVSHPTRRGALCNERAHITALPFAPKAYSQRQTALQDQRQHIAMLRLAHMSLFKPRAEIVTSPHAGARIVPACMSPTLHNMSDALQPHQCHTDLYIS